MHTNCSMLTLCLFFAANLTYTNATHPYMPILGESAVASVAMVAAPNLLGSIVRIPVAMSMEKFSSRNIHLFITLFGLLGIVGLTVISFATQNMTELGIGIYVGYLVCGAIGGIGKL